MITVIAFLLMFPVGIFVANKIEAAVKQARLRAARRGELEMILAARFARQDARRRLMGL